MDQYMGKLEEIIFKEKYTLRPAHLINLFGLHIKQAKFLLEQFANKHKKNIIIKFGLIGYQHETIDEIEVRHFVVVKSDDVENEKKKFVRLISCSIRSVKEKHNLLNIDYPIDNFVSNKVDLIDYQKKGYCINESIDFREDKLKFVLKKLNDKKKNNKKLNAKSIESVSDLPATKEIRSSIKHDKNEDLNDNKQIKRSATFNNQSNEDLTDLKPMIKKPANNQRSIMNFFKPKNQAS